MFKESFILLFSEEFEPLDFSISFLIWLGRHSDVFENSRLPVITGLNQFELVAETGRPSVAKLLSDWDNDSFLG